ncbi:MAG TPA: DUF1573 domain-containing protein [Nitrospirota bacterium]
MSFYKKATCFVLALCMAALIVSPASAAPRLALSATKWDMGEIYQWTNPSTTIYISNTGDRDLEITNVLASCGCTAVFLSEKVIKPGDKGSLRIDFASYNFSGKVNKIVRLTTNDPAAETTDITVAGNISEDKAGMGSISPAEVDLGVVAPYETRYIDAEIKNSGNVDLNILGIEMPDGFFLDSSVPNLAKARGGIPVRFGYRPPRDKGPIEGEIKVKTSGREGNLLTIKLAGYIGESARGADTLVVTPTGFVAGPGGWTLTLSIKNDGASPVTLDGVDSSLDLSGQELGDSELRPGDTGTVKLMLDPKGLRTGTRGYIYLRVGLPVEVVAPAGE